MISQRGHTCGWYKIISTHCVCSTAPLLTTGKKIYTTQRPIKVKEIPVPFFEHMCSFKNKHNRFAAKIIGAVNNFVNKFWALQRKLAISPHFPKIPLKEAVVHTKPIEQSINQWNGKYSIFEPQPNDLKTRYSILASCLICPRLK